MPYVLRDAQGRIASIHRHAVAGAQHLPAGHPELQQVLGARGAEAISPPAEPSFASLDADLISATASSTTHCSSTAMPRRSTARR